MKTRFHIPERSLSYAKIYVYARKTRSFSRKLSKISRKKIFFAKKFGSFRKTYYLCIAFEKQCYTASIAQLVRAPDC